jgi:hypothetical protein
MGKRNHHYVPKMYLRAFASSSPRTINLYNLDNRMAVQDASLADQCYVRHFYGETDDIEDGLGDLERLVAPSLHQVISTSQLPAFGTQEYLRLVVFVALQTIRTTRAVDRMNTGIDKFVKQLAGKSAEFKDMDLASMRIGISNAPSYSLGFIEPVLSTMGDLGMQLICAGPGQNFITSDNPVFRYNQFMQGITSVGVTGGLCRGIQVFVPLSPKHMLMLYDESVYEVGGGQWKGKRQDVTHRIPNQDVTSLNALQVHSADHNLYFNDRSMAEYVEYVAKKAIGKRQTDRTRVEEFIAEGDSRRSLITQHEEMPNLVLRLSFVRLHDVVKRLSVENKLSKEMRFRREAMGIEKPKFPQRPTDGRPVVYRRSPTARDK